MSLKAFLPKKYDQHPNSGTISFQAPSNIALVKYWGKHGMQLPKNASISFTLSESYTETTLSFTRKSDSGIDFEILFEGKSAPDFKPKIQSFLERVETYVPFVKDYFFQIETQNTFPHSSGIASSASGMSALAMCLMALEKQLLGEGTTFTEADLRKASFLARLGSGSACRSVEGPLVVWGEHPAIEGSSDLYGVQYPYEVHEVFEGYQDTILLVDKGEKQVSSTVGHGLMHDHPFANERFQQAQNHLSDMVGVLQEGDVDRFMEIVESEALSLHAMMMTSKPYFILMKPNTLEIINRIWIFRKETQIPVCFTLDAGANVHVLYPETFKDPVMQLISKDLAQFCQKGQYICDQIGFGAKKL